MSYRIVNRKSIFDSQQFLKSVEVTHVQDGMRELFSRQQNEKLDSNEEDLESIAQPQISQPSQITTLTCRLCGISFESVEKHRNHFKSEWHKFNIKLQLNGMKSVSEREFSDILESGDLSDSSQSGDEDSEKDNKREAVITKEAIEPKLHRSPKIVFTASDGTHFSVWKRVLLDISEEQLSKGEETVDYVSLLHKLCTKRKWVFLMCSGGHFAGSVFEGNQLVKHKTFHRYTVRKKQGGSQSTRDNKSATSQPKSMGAQIRRQNEVKLEEDIHQVLSDWKVDIDTAHVIFLSAPGVHNIKIFYYKESPLMKGDGRVKAIPFTTKRPTLIEIKRSFQLLSTIDFLELIADSNNATEHEEEVGLVKNEIDLMIEGENESESEEDQSEEEEDAEDLVLTAIRSHNLARLKSLYEQGYLSPLPADPQQLITPLYLAVSLGYVDIIKYLVEEVKENINGTIPGWLFRTALHRAAFDGAIEIMELLLENGVDPAIRGLDSKTAYQISKNKATLTAFRKFAGKHPTVHNWESIGVVPLTDELEAEQHQRKLDKKKQKKKSQQEKQKQKKIEEKIAKEKEDEAKELEEIEKKREKTLSQMNDRDVRARAAEVRIALASNTIPKCDECSTPLVKIPFERLDFHYCSMNCLKLHKSKMESKQ